MIETIVLEDNKKDLDLIIIAIENYSSNFHIHRFNDLTSCTEYIKEHPVDVAFFDIEIENQKSFTILEDLKRETIVVFISNYPSYALNCFNYRTLSFIEKNKLNELLPSILLEIESILSFKTKKLSFIKRGQKVDLFFKNILYIEREKNHICITYMEDSIKEIRIQKSIKNILEQLTEEFILIERGIVVNFHHIKSFNENQIIMDNLKLFYISRRFKKKVTETYFSLQCKRISSI